MIRVRHATMGDRAVVSSCDLRPVFDILLGCSFSSKHGARFRPEFDTVR
jgi:hypothetical protein